MGSTFHDYWNRRWQILNKIRTCSMVEGCFGAGCRIFEHPRGCPFGTNDWRSLDTTSIYNQLYRIDSSVEVTSPFTVKRTFSEHPKPSRLVELQEFLKWIFAENKDISKGLQGKYMLSVAGRDRLRWLERAVPFFLTWWPFCSSLNRTKSSICYQYFYRALEMCMATLQGEEYWDASYM